MKMLFAAVASCLLLAFAAEAQEPASVAAMRGDARFRAAAERQFLIYEASLSTHCQQISPDWQKARHLLLGPVQTDNKGLMLNAT